MKEDKYRAECSNRFELVSIEQAKAQGTSYIVHVVMTWLPALWWIQVHSKDQRDYSTAIMSIYM